MQGFIEEINELDLDGIIGRMDPEEMAVLYRYSPLFLEEGQAGLDDMRQAIEDQDVTWSITNIDLDPTVEGDEATVEIRGMDLLIENPDFSIVWSYQREQITADVDAGDLGSMSMVLTPRTLTIEGTIDGQSVNIDASLDTETQTATLEGVVAGESVDVRVTIDPDGECSQYLARVAGEVDEQGCLEDELDSESDFVIGQISSFMDNLGEEFPGLPMTVREVDGLWYVAPITTGMDYYVTWLRQFEDDGFEVFFEGAEPAFAIDNSVLDAIDTIDDLAGGSITTSPVDDDFQTIEPDLFEGQFEDDGFFESIPDELPQDFSEEALSEDEFFDDAPVEAILDEILFFDGPGAVSASLLENTYDIVQIDVPAGETMIVTMQRTDDFGLDTKIVVYGPNGLAGENDDADPAAGLPNTFDSQVIIQDTAAGTYTIEARSFADLGEGDYTLTVEFATAS